MKQFTSANDVEDISALVKEAQLQKKDPFGQQSLGKNKTLGLVFLNPSLRTRLSTQKAAFNLGMNVMVMNFTSDGWGLETADGIVMSQGPGEHIREAAAVIGQYCDIIGIRSFPGLKDREKDYQNTILHKMIDFSGVPVVSLESGTLHPLQSLADLLTIQELKKKDRPKVVLTWAPHKKALPQAVPNSFAQWMNKADVDFVITHPEGYELAPEFAGDAPVVHNQDEAFKDADFIYAKNWSAYHPYGQVLSTDESWMITNEKMKLTNQGRFMHCLPVRRNLVVTDEVLDGEASAVIHQAGNRVWSAQAVLKNMLESL